MVGYKLFKRKNGKLFPLYVDANEEIVMNEWIKAKEGERRDDGKVKSKLGGLCYRPGFHITEIPFADHIGTKQADGTLAQAKDTVWCEVEISDDVDYTEQVRQYKKNGDINYVKSYMTELPVDGYYWFQTNANAKARWLIAGAIKVNRVLDYAEITKLCRAKGFEPQKLAQRGEMIMEKWKKEYLNIARDLRYSEKCREKIKAAKTEFEAERALTNARQTEGR